MSANNANAQVVPNLSSPPEDYITTKQLAQLLKTNPSVIKQSRSSGRLFGRTPPEFIPMGERKLLYKLSDVHAWMDSFAKQTVTTNAEQAHLKEAREGALS